MRRKVRAVAAAAVVLGLGAAGVVLGPKYYIRYFQGNFRPVVEGQVYRSAQPTPAQLAKWKEEKGLRTVINLRGADPSRPDYQQEVKSTAELKLKQIDITWSAKRMPGDQAIKALLDALADAPRPVLMHCAAGVDRTGVASVIAAMSIGGADYRTAKKQLSSRYRGVNDEGDGIFKLMADYEEYCAKRGADTGAWPEFKRWLLETYPASFSASRPQEAGASSSP